MQNTKEMLMNDIVAEMVPALDAEKIERLKNVLIVKMHGWDIIRAETALSTWTDDNDFILKRFAVDQTAKGLAKRTIEHYLETMNRLFADLNMNYRQVTGQDITDYLAMKQIREGISQNYKVNIFHVVSAFYSWAYRKKYVENNPVFDMDSLRPKQKKKDRLTEEEMERIRDACESVRERAIVEFLFSTGVRVSELVSLDRQDVDLVSREVCVLGKGDKYRTVLLNVKARMYLQQYLADRDDFNPALFVSERHPHKRLTTDGMERIVKRLGWAAGAHLTTTVHVFRKTFASEMYNAGMDIVDISALLGHAGTDVTLKYYVVTDLDKIKAQHRRAA